MDFSASPPLAPHHREHALECRHCAEWDLINLRGERIGTQSQAHRVSRTHKPCPTPPGLPHAQHTQVWEQTDTEPQSPMGCAGWVSWVGAEKWRVMGWMDFSGLGQDEGLLLMAVY